MVTGADALSGQRRVILQLDRPARHAEVIHNDTRGVSDIPTDRSERKAENQVQGHRALKAVQLDRHWRAELGSQLKASRLSVRKLIGNHRMVRNVLPGDRKKGHRWLSTECVLPHAFDVRYGATGRTGDYLNVAFIHNNDYDICNGEGKPSEL